MSFYESRVYTALNADELEKGDVVFVADTLAELKETRSIRTINCILEETVACRFGVNLENPSYDRPTRYALAYLISKHDDPYKEFKKAQATGREVWINCGSVWRSNKHNDKYTEWSFDYPPNYYSLTNPEEGTKYYCFLSDQGFVYDCMPHNARHVFAEFDVPSKAASWCLARAKFVRIAQEWLAGKKIEVRNPASNEWKELEGDPTWCTELEYRIKPEMPWKDFHLGDKVEYQGVQQMVIAIDTTDELCHICISSGWWLTDEDLKKVKKLEV